MSRPRVQSDPLGSVYQRGDGYWVAALRLAGRKIVRYGKTEREARQKLAELQREHHLGTLAAPSKLKLSDWLTSWQDQQQANVRPSTLATYRQVLTPVAAKIGGVRLDRVTPALVAGTLAELRRSGMGSRRVQMAYTYLRASLGTAAQLGLIGSNPVVRVPKPGHRAADRTFWDEEQARRFLLTTRRSKHHHAPLLVFLVGTGARVGEALGLEWRDVDLSRGIVRILRSVVWADNKPTVQQPKTAAGQRTIALPAFGSDALLGLPRPVSSEARVFVTRLGTTPTRRNLTRALHALCREAEVPVLGLHGLRHVHAAMLLASGIDLQALRRRLGHARVDISLDRYAYVVAPDERSAAALDQALVITSVS